MWLVLCDASDVSALWVASAFRTRGLSALEVVTADALALAEFRAHRIDGMRTTLQIRPDGLAEIDADRLDGVFNRLYTVPTAHWRQAPQYDRDYVQQELSALFLSWLHALPCPVVNRATPQGLCGRWRQESEWVVLARRAGLPVGPYRHASTDRVDPMEGRRRLVPDGRPATTAIVVGESVTGMALPRAIGAACVRLATLAETELLGVDFVTDESGALRFAGANPMPDLRLGGQLLVDALVHQLTVKEEAA